MLALEPVTTQAGTFKAHKIQQEWIAHAPFGDRRWTNVLWFAPELKSAVKFTTTSRAGQDWELTSYRLQ